MQNMQRFIIRLISKFCTNCLNNPNIAFIKEGIQIYTAIDSVYDLAAGR